MDYNQLVEGTTVYLPVYHPGALLFVGDGHAAGTLRSSRLLVDRLQYTPPFGAAAAMTHSGWSAA
jgi:Acetamidase/Formamidase family